MRQAKLNNRARPRRRYNYIRLGYTHFLSQWVRISTYAWRINSFRIIATWYQSFYKQVLQCCLESLDCVAINNFRRKSIIYQYQSQCTSTFDVKEVPVFDIHQLAIMPAASWSCAVARLWIFKRIVENGLGRFPTLFDAETPNIAISRLHCNGARLKCLFHFMAWNVF